MPLQHIVYSAYRTTIYEYATCPSAYRRARAAQFFTGPVLCIAAYVVACMCGSTPNVE